MIRKIWSNSIVPVSGAIVGGALQGIAVASTAQAGFDEKAAASFAAKYEVCAERLAKIDMHFRAAKLRREVKEITRNNIGDGYLEHFNEEKKFAWAISLIKCKKFADKL